MQKEVIVGYLIDDEVHCVQCEPDPPEGIPIFNDNAFLEDYVCSKCGKHLLQAGKRWCPNCKQTYTPRYPIKEAVSQTEDREGREQWISGICSNQCWKDHLGINPNRDPEITFFINLLFPFFIFC